MQGKLFLLTTFGIITMTAVGAVTLKEGAIKLPFLAVDTTPLPEMSPASAVRMACVVAIDDSKYYGSRNASLPPAPTTQPSVKLTVSARKVGVQTNKPVIPNVRVYGIAPTVRVPVHQFNTVPPRVPAPASVMPQH